MARLNPAEMKRRKAREGKLKALHDFRRFKIGTVADGNSRVLAAKDATGTLHPKTVRTWAPGETETILKDGRNSSKIGGAVLRGEIKGAKILTFALEERATCPRACAHWRTCYGNNLHLTRRWSPNFAMFGQITREIEAACATYDHVLIRLHVLGDFYSFDYLRFWVDLLDKHENLWVFGFTAHKPDTEIGRGIVRVREALGRRFSIRHSGVSGEWGTVTIPFPTDAKRIGDIIVCPEQRAGNGDDPDETKHCGSCALCWRTSAPIGFIQH
ncbi:hypothetical protein [Maritimibacter sp. DP1N21-5]|uniref:hypothetical protein n=1 Tax=Maritimibacter sp. DP1N21-5 TaxID=2836867 RepID=UPI001C43BB5C|nr:hypothetical protein [Maritimibacter sp. DP1N21-5]MBV7408730.1 hypothetical protein [Maritimibacter sp. DP1N21-5]